MAAVPLSSRRLGVLVVVYVSAFAFLLASFPARNSDLWAHLAAGRDLVQGSLFGTAFAPTDGPSPWLYDLLAYSVYSVGGGPGLVFFKALLVAGLGLVLLQLSRTGGGWWIPAVCTVLALLTMGTRLLLQPATVSLLLLALTLAVLRRREETLAGRMPPWLPPWTLVVLFVAWVNLDRWFLLGLGVVALVWLGTVLDLIRQGDRETGRQGDKERGPVSLSPCLPVSLSLLTAACLLNPSHVHAFVPPPELRGLALPSGTGPVTSPFQRSYLTTLGQSPAALAYYPLLGLGLLSFVLTLPRWHWRRFLPWLGLAVLSGLQVRAVPFFAVVAGPVLAWNLEEFFARHSEAERRQGTMWGRGAAALRGLTVVLGLAFLACAWPGWLQAPPFEPRRWAIETAPSLEHGALALRRWHQEGKLGPTDRGLHLSPETAAAFAWFFPEEKGVRADRLDAALRGTPEESADSGERMHAAGITHLIVYDPDRGRLFATLDRMLADPELWPLLFLEGDLAVFGWRDPARAGAADLFRGLELDLNRLAFHPPEDKKAPRTRPEREPEPRRWWEAFWKPAPPRQIDRDEATLQLLHAEAQRRLAPHRHLIAWENSQAAALVGAAGTGAGPGALFDIHLRLVLFQPRVSQQDTGADGRMALDQLALLLQQQFTLQRDDTNPALLYLAIRSARRALAVNPNDAEAYLVLGQSYLWLLHSTRERAWGQHLPKLVRLRHAQACTALNQALSLKPTLAQAHLSLGGLYQELGYFDLALHHLQTHLILVRKAGPPPDVSAGQFREQLAAAEQRLSGMAEALEEQRDAYAKESGKLRVQDRAMLAVKKGLAGKARDLLLETDVAAFGARGMALELELLLRTGRVREVREWTAPEQKAALGDAAYHWLRTQALAASGDYAAAEEELAYLDSGDWGHGATTFDEAVALAVGQRLLDEQPGGGLLTNLTWRALGRIEFDVRLADLGRGMRQKADVAVFRGLLALENGEAEEAEAAFRAALAFWDDRAAAASASALDFGGRVIAEDCLRWLE